MIRKFTHIHSIFYRICLLCLGMLLVTQAFAQNRSDEGAIKRNWYDSILRLVKGGDGHYYLLRTRDGRFWSFGGEGQYRFDMLRFDPEFQLVNTVKIRASQGDLGLENAFEILPAPDGIAFLSIRRDDASSKLQLQLCQPYFDRKTVYSTCTALADMPGFTPRIARPDVRVAWAPDSSRIAITWRKLANQKANDNATQCLVLNRKLEVVHGPFAPLPPTSREFRLLRIGALDADNLIFFVRSFQTSGVFSTPKSGAFHLLVHHLPDSSVREIHLDGSSRMLMDIQLDFSQPDKIKAAGWWLNGDLDNRKAGIFIGELGSGDTLDNLRMHAFEKDLHTEMLPKTLNDGTVWFRPSYHNRLLATSEGYAYILHLTGNLFPVILVEHPGDRYNHALVAFHFGDDGGIRREFVMGFLNEGRTDYQETYSWIPVESDGQPYALVTDYNGIGRLSKSHEAQSLLLPLSEEGELQTLQLGKENENLILAPRLYVREGENTSVFVARSKNTYRLVRVKF